VRWTNLREERVLEDRGRQVTREGSGAAPCSKGGMPLGGETVCLERGGHGRLTVEKRAWGTSIARKGTGLNGS